MPLVEIIWLAVRVASKNHWRPRRHNGEFFFSISWESSLGIDTYLFEKTQEIALLPDQLFEDHKLKLPLISRASLDAYNVLSVPVWVFSVGTLRILSANAAACEWIGYDEKALQAMTIADLRPEAERDRIVDRVRQFGGPSSDAGTWTIVSKSGDRYSASFTWSRVTFEGAEAIVASIRDVTQIARAEAIAATLSEENETLRWRANLSAVQLSMLFDSLPGKLLVLTPGDYCIVAATDEYAQSVMVDRDVLLGEYLFELFPDDPAETDSDGTRNLRASLQRVEALRVTDVMNVQRYPVRQPDGRFQVRFWLPRNKPILNADGDLIYIVHRVEDVTDIFAASNPQLEDREDANGREPSGVSEAHATIIALREREVRLKTAEKLLDLGAWECDFERGALNWSDRVFDIYGAPRDRGGARF